MSIRWLSAAAGAAAALMSASAASAAIVHITYTGTVLSGSDQGVFGGNDDLTGSAFTANFVFDTTKGATLDDKDPVHPESYARGGMADGDASPALGASITINGLTYVIDTPDTLGEIYQSADTPYQQDHLAEEQITSFAGGSFLFREDYLFMYFYGPSPTSIDQPFSVTGPGQPANPLFASEFYSDIVQVPGVTRQIDLMLNPTSLTEAVPEPGAWALMLLGFGGAGAVLRTRRRKLVSALSAWKASPLG